MWPRDRRFGFTARQTLRVCADVIDVLRKAHRRLASRPDRHAGFVLDALEPSDPRPAACARRQRPCPSPATGAANICRSNTPSAWRGRASRPRSAVSATAATTPSRNRLTAYTKPRSYIGMGHGAHLRASSSRCWNGWAGSTIAGCWRPAATSRRPTLNCAATPCATSRPSPRSSNETASGKPGAVQNPWSD